jgi:hypothetical protein
MSKILSAAVKIRHNSSISVKTAGADCFQRRAGNVNRPALHLLYRIGLVATDPSFVGWAAPVFEFR